MEKIPVNVLGAEIGTYTGGWEEVNIATYQFYDFTPDPRIKHLLFPKGSLDTCSALGISLATGLVAISFGDEIYQVVKPDWISVLAGVK